MTLTTREWRSSADIFAMEYADILERHKILYGEAPFDGIRVAPRDLREPFARLFTQGMIRMGGSKMFVQVGTRVKVEDLIRGVIVQSGNDACIVLAEGIAGSEEAFHHVDHDIHHG